MRPHWVHSRHSRHRGLSGSPQERTFNQCPRFMSARPAAWPKTNLMKSRRSVLAGRRAVRDSEAGDKTKPDRGCGDTEDYRDRRGRSFGRNGTTRWSRAFAELYRERAIKSSRPPRFSSPIRFRSPFCAKRTGNCGSSTPDGMTSRSSCLGRRHWLRRTVAIHDQWS